MCLYDTFLSEVFGEKGSGTKGSSFRMKAIVVGQGGIRGDPSSASPTVLGADMRRDTQRPGSGAGGNSRG